MKIRIKIGEIICFFIFVFCYCFFFVDFFFNFYKSTEDSGDFEVEGIVNVGLFSGEVAKEFHPVRHEVFSE